MKANEAKVENNCLTIGPPLDIQATSQSEALLNELARRWNLHPELIDFLRKAEIVFNHAILSTPTGESRNQFTVLNIHRIDFMAKGEIATSHSKRLHEVLDMIKAADEELDIMCADDSRLGDALPGRAALVDMLLKILNE